MHKIYILLMILTIVSCDRNNEEDLITQVNITVRDRETSDTLPGAGVVILKVKRTDLSVVSNENHGIADTNGFYTHRFSADPEYYYYATASYGNYIIPNHEIINNGRENNINVKLAKAGWLAIHIKNTSPLDTNDLINVFNSDYYLANQIFNGMAVDTTIVITSYGNQSNPVNWKVTKNDTTITYNQSFNYISLDTISFDLFY